MVCPYVQIGHSNTSFERENAGGKMGLYKISRKIGCKTSKKVKKFRSFHGNKDGTFIFYLKNNFLKKRKKFCNWGLIFSLFACIIDGKNMIMSAKG